MRVSLFASFPSSQTHRAQNYTQNIDTLETLAGVQDVYDFFADVADRGDKHVEEWNATVKAHAKKFPDLGAEFKLRVEGKMPGDWTKYIPAKEALPTSPTASRKSGGLVGNPLYEHMKNFMVGTADLTPSCNVAYPNRVDFQSVSRDVCTIVRMRRIH